MPEKILKCLECGKNFTFFEEEQRWFASKGFMAPKRCKPCRIARREKKTAKPRASRPPAQHPARETPQRREG